MHLKSTTFYDFYSLQCARCSKKGTIKVKSGCGLPDSVFTHKHEYLCKSCIKTYNPELGGYVEPNDGGILWVQSNATNRKPTQTIDKEDRRRIQSIQSHVRSVLAMKD